MQLLRGRAFTADDRDGRPKVCVVNESMARHFFGAVDPIGHHIGYGDPTDIEVIGLLHDARVDGLKSDVPWMVFYPIAQGQGEFARSLYVRVTGPVEAAKASLRSSILSVNPNLAVREVTTLGVMNERTVSTDRLVSRLTGMFGLLAVGVACLGLYGTVATRSCGAPTDWRPHGAGRLTRRRRLARTAENARARRRRRPARLRRGLASAQVPDVVAVRDLAVRSGGACQRGRGSARRWRARRRDSRVASLARQSARGAQG
jgi:hypothetical protein